ncbi:hypothetical protein TREMEDRAFT_61584 [Tremella mesenterica DSM 1558]|uniref:uncharacterized protein n=1 Tax=Tremella mesenterica (strain ATCC 24925 / CBS 8224 / DSM 1558 / NBRC 9311 / NRRL Y-6157 / RJB 2259-6 / UBC 559-6) TaxID=578456 RepID=UPI0003F49078|nr:uncharacterized protein TREMEDRAFT_61584 [Tremella mesenterica DSM 1558]EIW69815.1 hypothetical protein TREMEDRAFT_61584 [Tremella mesenterica DSM 1558]
MTLGGPSRPKRPLPSPVDLTTPTPPKQTGPLDQYFLFKPGPSPSKPLASVTLDKGKGRVIDLTSDTSSKTSKVSKAASTRSASDEDLPSVYDQLVKSWSQQGIAHSPKTKVSQTHPSSLQAQSYPHGSKLKSEPISPVTKRHKNRPAISHNFVASSSSTSELRRKAKIYPSKGHGTFLDPLEILSSEGSSSSGTPREPLKTLPNPRKPPSVPVSSISVPPARPSTKDLHENSALVSQVSLPLLSDITSVPITASPLKSRPGRGAFGSHVKRNSMSPGALKGRSINLNLSQTSSLDTNPHPSLFAPRRTTQRSTSSLPTKRKRSNKEQLKDKDEAYHPHSSTSDRSQPSKRIELRKRDNTINYEIPALDAEQWPIGPPSHSISSRKPARNITVLPAHPTPAHSPLKTSSPLTPLESQDDLWSLNSSPERPPPQVPPEPLPITKSMFVEDEKERQEPTSDEPEEPVEEADILDEFAEFDFAASQHSQHSQPNTPSSKSIINTFTTPRSTRKHSVPLSSPRKRPARASSHPALTPSKLVSHASTALSPPLRSPMVVMKQKTPMKSHHRLPVVTHAVEELMAKAEAEAAARVEHEARKIEERRRRMQASNLDVAVDTEKDEPLEEINLSLTFASKNEKEIPSIAEDFGPSRRSTRAQTKSTTPQPQPKAMSKPKVLTDGDKFFRALPRAIRRNDPDAPSRTLDILRGCASRREHEVPYPTPDSAEGSGDSSDLDEHEEVDLDAMEKTLAEDAKVDVDVLRRVRDGAKESNSRRESMDGWDGFWGPRIETMEVERKLIVAEEVVIDGDAIEELLVEAMNADDVPTATSLITSNVVVRLANPGGSSSRDPKKLLLLECVTEWLITTVFATEDPYSALAVDALCHVFSLNVYGHICCDDEYKRIIDVWRALGAKADYLITDDFRDERMESGLPARLPLVRLARDAACQRICELVSCTISRMPPVPEYHWLTSGLIALAVDRSTSQALRRCIDETLAKIWDIWSENDEDGFVAWDALVQILQTSIPKETYPVILQAVGQRNEASCEIGQRIAMDFLLPEWPEIFPKSCLKSIPWAPPIQILLHAAKEMYQSVLSSSTDWVVFEGKLSYLSVAMGNMDALVARCPMDMELGLQEALEKHPIMELRGILVRIHGRIREVPEKLSTRQISVGKIKARLSQMTLTLKMRLEDSAKRYRRTLRPRLGPSLEEGSTGGQTRLMFGADKHSTLSGTLGDQIRK